ncbi:MAG: hypothetical protein IPO85_18310 [Saprospiraceae bacterium]|uniref:RDD domain-containing protein n=1 Tax=Candidatus Defluviibacterium haderslevense TaxID=2981993 RepID=A0A9D7XJ52_9BACT|nr:hypothetical protein [Candidatus Defluviibacterium haderslevense]
MKLLTTLDKKSSNQILPPNCVLASPTKRFWAEMINALIFGWPILAIRQGSEFTWISKDDLYIIPITVITSAIFYPFFSGSLGHRILGIKVVSIESGKDKNQFFLEYIVNFSSQYWGILLYPLFGFFGIKIIKTCTIKLSKL